MSIIQFSTDGTTYYSFTAEQGGVDEAIEKKGAEIELLDGATHFDYKATKRNFGFSFSTLNGTEYDNLVTVVTATNTIIFRGTNRAGSAVSYTGWIFGLDNPLTIKTSTTEWYREAKFTFKEQ